MCVAPDFNPGLAMVWTKKAQPPDRLKGEITGMRRMGNR
jgi:hypothetical protein